MLLCLWFLDEIEHAARWANLNAVHADCARKWNPLVDVSVFRNELSRGGDVIYSRQTHFERTWSWKLDGSGNDGVNRKTARLYGQRVAESIPMSHACNSLFWGNVKDVTAVAIEEGR